MLPMAPLTWCSGQMQVSSMYPQYGALCTMHVAQCVCFAGEHSEAQVHVLPYTSLCMCAFGDSVGSAGTHTHHTLLVLHDQQVRYTYSRGVDSSRVCRAGLAAYPSWVPTIERLTAPSWAAVPRVFTDHCEEAAVRAATVLTGVSGRRLSLPVTLNPFRQPLSSQGSDNALPTYSNAFLLGWV